MPSLLLSLNEAAKRSLALSNTLESKIRLSQSQCENKHRLSTWRTFLLTGLFEMSVVVTMVSTLIWLVNYRGGFQLITTLEEDEDSRETKHRINLHCLAMMFSLSFFLPQVVAAKSALYSANKKCFYCCLVTMKVFTIMAYMVGLIQIYNTHDYLAEKADHGIHFIMCMPCMIFVPLYGFLNFLRGVKHLIGDVEKLPTFLSFLLTILTVDLLQENVELLLALLGFLANLTGFLSYALIILDSVQFDTTSRGLFTLPVHLGEEKKWFLVAVCSLGLVFLAFGANAFIRHDILYHTDIITYSMYHNNFVDIAEALSRDNQQQHTEHLADIEKLCRFQPRTGKVVCLDLPKRFQECYENMSSSQLSVKQDSEEAEKLH